MTPNYISVWSTDHLYFSELTGAFQFSRVVSMLLHFQPVPLQGTNNSKYLERKLFLSTRTQRLACEKGWSELQVSLGP
jgi:hypothetical protein